jgi:hypothetical protein
MSVFELPEIFINLPCAFLPLNIYMLALAAGAIFIVFIIEIKKNR